ncbi:hypothetical protein JCM13304A_08300 [Desulfothermus okinawensis JCM 13304]
MFLKYGVTPEKIIEFASNPDFNLPDDIFSNREWRIKKINGRCLKIVIEYRGNEIIIITAYFDRTLRRKGLCE